MSWEPHKQLLSFEKHSLVHFSSDLCRTQSLISFISPLNCYLWKRVFPDSLYLKHTWYPHLCHNISASLHPTLHFCSIFQLPFHYILCLLSSVNTVYCLRSSFTEPAAPASCSLLTPSTCQGTTTWEACSEYLLNKWMIVEQSRDCNPRLSASKIHALFHSTTQNSKAHNSVAVTSLSVQFSRSVVSESLRPHGLQHARPLCPSPTLGVYPNACLSSPSPPTFNPSQGLFKWVSPSHQVVKVLEFQLQYQSFQWTLRTDFLQNRLVGSPCSPRDSQDSSPTPQLKSINSSALSFLYSSTRISIHDHRLD